MSTLDGYVLIKDGQYLASHYGKALGAFPTEDDALRAIAEVTEGRPTHIVGDGAPKTLTAAELRAYLAAR
jgi:hypothetical protein